jgi:hypothetical protein
VSEPAFALAWEQQAAVVGAYRWTCERLFALCGTWSTSAAAPEVAVLLAALSTRSGWHASMWAERLPVRDGIDPEELSAPLGSSGSLLGDLGSDEGPPAPSAEADAWRMGGLLVVLRRLATTYEAHRRRAVTVSEGPVIEVLDVVLAHLGEDVERCADCLAALEPPVRGLADARRDALDATAPPAPSGGLFVLAATALSGR